MRRMLLAAVLAGTSVGSIPEARANVFDKAENGFVVRHAADVSASPDETWKLLVTPSKWWNGEHSFSGDAANFTLDARGGGCFCEILPNRESPRAAPRGSVEHMRVVYAEKDRVLRMTGGLGPLQSEAVQGVLTIVLKPIDGGGTRILWEYVVGGYMRLKSDAIAPAVDTVLGDQLARLAAMLGPAQAGQPVEQAEPKEPEDVMQRVIEGR